MRKLLVLFFIGTAVFSCREPLLDSLPRAMRGQDRFARYARAGTGPDSLPAPPDPLLPPEPGYVPSVYCTAVHFKDSANWRTDSLLSAEVLLFKDGSLLQRQPIPSPPDPERHRVWAGRLWTDATDGHQTVLSCDGEERFRYAGEEVLRGFLIKNGEVHTLGQSPGEGFSYRINGEEVFSSAKGTILGSPSSPEWRCGGFSPDGDAVYYCYSVPVRVKDKTLPEYHVMKGSEAVLTLPAGTADALLDLRVRNGKVYRAEQRAGQLYLEAGEDSILLTGGNVRSCRLIPLGDGLTVLGATRVGLRSLQFWYYDLQQKQCVNLAVGLSEKSTLVMAEDNWLLADVMASGYLTQLQHPGGSEVLPVSALRCSTPLCLFVSAQDAAAALSHGKNNQHPLYRGGESQPFSFNGYFTSVVIE